jgi:hypothetical protein
MTDYGQSDAFKSFKNTHTVQVLEILQKENQPKTIRVLKE